MHLIQCFTATNAQCCPKIHYDTLTTFHLTLTAPTMSSTEAAMQQIIIAYMKNLSSADQQYHTTVFTQLKITQLKNYTF